MWTLIVVTWVYGGSVVTFHDFGSKEYCEAAQKVFAERMRYGTSYCVNKGVAR